MEAQTAHNSANLQAIPTSGNETFMMDSPPPTHSSTSQPMMTQDGDSSLSNCEVVACGTVVAKTELPMEMQSQPRKPRGCSKRLSMDERYKVRELYCNGVPKLRIARMLNLNWRTVQKIAKKVDAGITDLSPMRPSRGSGGAKGPKMEFQDEQEVASTSTSFQQQAPQQLPPYSEPMQLQHEHIPQSQSSIIVINGLPHPELNGKKFIPAHESLHTIKGEYVIMKNEGDDLPENTLEDDMESVSVKSELKDDNDDHIIDVVTPEPEERRVRTKKSVAEALRAKRAAAMAPPPNGPTHVPSTSQEIVVTTTNFTPPPPPTTVHRILVHVDQFSAKYSIIMRVKCVCWYDVGFTVQDIIRLFEAEFGEELQPPPIEIIKYWHERLCNTGSVL